MKKKRLHLYGMCMTVMILAISCAGTPSRQLLSDPDIMEMWPLNDGGTGGSVASGIRRGTRGRHTWGIWLPTDTFGFTLDFSVQGSSMKTARTKIDLSGDFTISAFILAPPRGDEDRTILAVGDNDLLLYLKADENTLAMQAYGLEGMAGGQINLADGMWHHIVVSRQADTVTFYVDGMEDAQSTVNGSIMLSSTAVTLGADAFGDWGLDGSLAQVTFFKGSRIPSDATGITIQESDQIPKAPRINISRGIVIDRPQYFSHLIHLSYTLQSDIALCKELGFDHVKLQLAPEWMISDSGALIRSNMEYILSVLDMVVELDYKAILCISPCAADIDYDFKHRYLGDLDNFEKLVRWYGELGVLIREKGYSPDNVCIQLMTEPYGNNQSVSWSWMSNRKYGALRNVLPDHTILTSSDRAGNMETLKAMTPATDWNLVYTFTTYEPYVIGWSSANTAQIGNHTFWDYLNKIPYPIEEGVDYSQDIEFAIKDVPDDQKNQARTAITNYVNGSNDYLGEGVWINHYRDTLYNRDWHFQRAVSLDQWRQKYGGNIHIMCVEFGSYHSRYAMIRFGAQGPGTPDSLRLEFIRDTRESFDAYGIGWSYWSYNEGFTIFNTDYHMRYVGGSPDPQTAASLVDYDLIIHSLGLHPALIYDVPEHLRRAAGAWKMGAQMESALPAGIDGLLVNATAEHDQSLGTVTFFNGSSFGIVDNASLRLVDSISSDTPFTVSAWVKTEAHNGIILSSGEQFLRQTDGVYNKLMIKDFDALHNVWGSPIVVSRRDPPQGSGSYESSVSTAGDIIIVWQLPFLDLSAYLKHNSGAALHLSVFTDNPSAISGGRLEFTGMDGASASWNVSRLITRGGWNDIIIPIENTGHIDSSRLTRARIFFNMNRSGTIRVDDLYIFHERNSSPVEYWRLFIDSGYIAFQAEGLHGINPSGAFVADGQWHHVMVSFDGSRFTYYINGRSSNSFNVTGRINDPSSADLIAGAGVDGSDGLTGYLANMAVYRISLRPDEVWK